MEEKLSDATAHVDDSPSPTVNDFDVVDKSAVGGRDVSELPPKYYQSLQIIGSVIVRIPISCLGPLT